MIMDQVTDSTSTLAPALDSNLVAAKDPEHSNFARLVRGAGINLKLQLAFGAVAAATVIAAAIAIVSFTTAERDVQSVANHEVPLMTDALRLSVISGEVSAAASRIVSAKTDADRKSISMLIGERTNSLKTTIEHLRANNGSDAFEVVDGTSKRLDGNLKELEAAIAERSNLRSRLDARIDEMHKAHAKISDKLTPIVDDLYFEVVTTAEDVGKTGDKIVKSLVNDGLQRMQAIIQIGSETNLIAGLLTAASLTNSASITAMLDDRITAAAQRARRLIAKLPKDQKFDNLRGQVTALLDLVDAKARTAEGENKRLQTIFRTHEGVSNLLISMIDDLNFDLVLQSEDAVKRSSKTVKGLVSNQISGLRNALEIAAQTHFVTNLISEGAIANDTAVLVPIRDRFKASADLIQKASKTLGQDDISKSIALLLTFGQGDESVFDLRAKELTATVRAERAIGENVKIQRDLDQAVSSLVTETEQRMNAGTANLVSELQRSRILLYIVAFLSMAAAAAIGAFYVKRNLVRRLTAISDTMQRLSQGDTDIAIPSVKDTDELGTMARAMLVFRNSAVEKILEQSQSAERDRRAAEAKIEQDRIAAEEKAAQERVSIAARDAALAEVMREFDAAVGGIAKAAMAGDFSQRVSLDGKEGVIRNLAETMNVMCDNIGHVLDDLAGMLAALAQGDLSHRIGANYQGTFAILKNNANTTGERLAKTISEIKAAAIEVSSASAEISTSTTDLSQRTEEQAASLEETSASMEQISATVKKNAENAHSASDLTSKTREAADRGGAVVTDAISAMSRIEESSRKIADIIGVIDEIARQTNLLALNAAVEAARAGDAGRGFAVVASEVRNLAQRSSQAAKDIKNLITSSSTQVQEGVSLVNRAGTSLHEIMDLIKTVSDIVSNIAIASAEQSTGLDQVNKALREMDEVTQHNSALVEENAATARTLKLQSAAMGERVSLFRIERAGAAASSQSDKSDDRRSAEIQSVDRGQTFRAGAAKRA